MEPKPNETVQETDAVAVEEQPTPATEEAAQTDTTEPTGDAPENSSSTEEDLSALIEAEKQQGKPDPEKARQAFLERQQKKAEPEEDTNYDEPEPEEQPLTRKEIETLLAQERQEIYRQANESQITTISEQLAETPQEAELIRAVHSNRVFPQGTPLREQLEEAKAIATYKRTQAKNSELARAVQSQQTMARNTATTHMDPQGSPAPNLAADMQASLQRAGFTYNNQARRYEKKLPNGKTLVRSEDGRQYLAD